MGIWPVSGLQAVHTGISLAAALACGLNAPELKAQTTPTTATAATVPADNEFQKLVLPLIVNGTQREPVVALIQGNEVWLALSDLENSGMLPGRTPPGLLRSLRGVPYLRLKDASTMLSYRFNDAELTLLVDLKEEFMSVNAIDLAPPRPQKPAQDGYATSAYLNYSLSGASQTRPSLFTEAVVSLRGHTLQGYFTHDSSGRSYRGPVSLSLNNETARRQVIFGDALWTGTGLLGGVPVGGVTVRSFFGYEPGFISTPTLGLRGYAATPSTVDVLVNGTLVGQRQIPAGPFELGSIVAQAGRNDVTAVVRDAFGRETLISGGALYGSPLLLAPGVSTYSVSAGRLRQDGTGQAPSYGDQVLLAQAATGLANSLTVGAGAQLSRRLKAVSAQVAATSSFGEIGVQGAKSQSANGGGLALALSYRLSTNTWGVNAALLRRQSGYTDLGAPDLPGIEKVLQSAEIGVGRRLYGVDLSLRLSSTRNSAALTLRRLALNAGYRWSDRLSTIVELARSTGQISDTSVFVLASYSLADDQTVSLASSRNNGQVYTTLDYLRTPQEALTTGYRLSNAWAADGSTRQFAQVSRDTTFGDYEVQASKSAGQTQTSWRASGALVAIGGTVAATPPIVDAFALVRVPDAPKVPVRLEGRFVGETDTAGLLIVPALGSYSRQRVSIDTEALPLAYEVGDVERRVSAPLRGGDIVEFEVKIYRAATGRLVDSAGKPVASAIVVMADGRRVSTGTSGDFVVEGEPPKGQAIVERNGVRGVLCRIQFKPLASDTSAVIRLGELPCRP